MSRLVTSALLMTTLAVGQAQAQSARDEFIPFPSASMTAEDFLTGKPGTPITLAGQLRLPKMGEKLPAVILVHGAGGVGGTRNAYDFWIPTLNAAGIATFAIDSFSGRSFFTYPAGVGKIAPESRTIDAFQALAALSKHPSIDPERIAVMGLSHGSVAAMLSNVTRFQKTYGSGASFTAHVSIYGICGTTYRGDEDATKPLLMLHGEADDLLPASACKEYEQRLLKAGKIVKFITYPGAHHAYDVPAFAQERKSPHFSSFRNCSWAEADNGQIVNVKSQQPFSWADPCLEKGVTIGYNEVAAKKSQEDVVTFLKDIFKLK